MSLNNSSIKVDTINTFSHQHLFKTQPFKKSETEVLIGWDDYDWDRLEYQSIYEVERALNQLDHFVENDPQTYPLEDYFYKIIRIGSELKFSEKTNDEYGEYTSDFYVQANFSM